MEMENALSMVQSPRLSLPADQRGEIIEQTRRQNWDFECPETVILLTACLDPTQSEGRDELPRALQEALWSRPMPGLGYLAAANLRLADLIEALSCPCVERIEGRWNYRPLERC